MKRLLFILVLIFPIMLLAQEVNPFEPPQWLKESMLFISSLPHVGPIFLKVMMWLGVTASILTVLATSFIAISKSLQKVLKLMKLEAWALKVEAFYLLVGPYLKFLSMYNVQKKELEREGNSKGTAPVA